MKVSDILHDTDECTMFKTIVSSHVCLNNWFFTTWNFNNFFELWFEDDQENCQIIKQLNNLFPIKKYFF